MSDAVELESNVPVTSPVAEQAAAPEADYKVVAGAQRSNEDELFGFRAAMAQAQQQVEAQPPPPKTNAFAIAVAVLFLLTLVPLGFFGIKSLLKPKTPSLYNDLGTQRYDPAGLGGRLIVKWSGSTTYKLSIDPVDPSLTASFQAVAANPPHAILFTVQLKDTTDAVVCQKTIVISGGDQASAPDLALVFAQQSTPTGDIAQNIAGVDGKVGEIVLTGPLSCTLDAYRRIAGWQFTTDFPVIADQGEWLKHEDIVEGKAKPASASAGMHPFYTLIKSLPAPIEGDDEIVSDNPSRGLVSTSSGRIFLVGTSTLVNRALDWQIFPAAIHFRCEKSAVCFVTRLSSRTTVQAHLVR